jgi:hypothetical protein
MDKKLLLLALALGCAPARAPSGASACADFEKRVTERLRTAATESDDAVEACVRETRERAADLAEAGDTNRAFDMLLPITTAGGELHERVRTLAPVEMLQARAALTAVLPRVWEGIEGAARAHRYGLALGRGEFVCSAWDKVRSPCPRADRLAAIRSEAIAHHLGRMEELRVRLPAAAQMHLRFAEIHAQRRRLPLAEYPSFTYSLRMISAVSVSIQAGASCAPVAADLERELKLTEPGAREVALAIHLDHCKAAEAKQTKDTKCVYRDPQDDPRQARERVEPAIESSITESYHVVGSITLGEGAQRSVNQLDFTTMSEPRRVIESPHCPTAAITGGVAKNQAVSHIKRDVDRLTELAEPSDATLLEAASRAEAAGDHDRADALVTVVAIREKRRSGYASGEARRRLEARQGGTDKSLGESNAAVTIF